MSLSNRVSHPEAVCDALHSSGGPPLPPKGHAAVGVVGLVWSPSVLQACSARRSPEGINMLFQHGGYRSLWPVMMFLPWYLIGLAYLIKAVLRHRKEVRSPHGRTG